jgi:hypothetical protein
MVIPRFTLLQLLGAMTVCGVLFCIAAIDPLGSTVALLVFLACIAMAFIMGALTYVLTRIISEMAFLVVGRPDAPSPFAIAETMPGRSSAPQTDLATAVESLQNETKRELGGQVLDVEPEPESHHE